jgi:bromodomain-containing factor 1
VHDDELELDVDEIPEPVLQDLYRFVKSHRKAVGADITGEDEDWEEPGERRLSGSNKPAATQRKKNKPMSAREQEHKIAQVRKQLERFDNSGGDGMSLSQARFDCNTDDERLGGGIDESSDDDTSSSSEEE